MKRVTFNFFLHLDNGKVNTEKKKSFDFFTSQLLVQFRLHQPMAMYLAKITNIVLLFNTGVNKVLSCMALLATSVSMENGTRQYPLVKVTNVITLSFLNLLMSFIVVFL